VTRIIQSSKYIIALLAMVALVILAILRLVEGEQAVQAIMVLVGLAIGGTAVEDAAGKIKA